MTVEIRYDGVIYTTEVPDYTEKEAMEYCEKIAKGNMPLVKIKDPEGDIHYFQETVLKRSVITIKK